jgi:hypothetical protein
MPMTIFQHPHLIRGIVQTSRGAFIISRGLVEAPDEVGESLGWRRIDAEEPRRADIPASRSTAQESSGQRDVEGRGLAP